MILRMSTLLLRTLRDDPADAEVPSHRLLVRAGYVRRVAPGVFSWLPLGYRTFRNVERIVREEMDDAGFQEVHFPALIPKEPYEATGRWIEYGDNLFRLQDRRGSDYLLGPTHEELFTQMVKGECSSYKDLPLVIYQIQTKYRDEARTKMGWREPSIQWKHYMLQWDTASSIFKRLMRKIATQAPAAPTGTAASTDDPEHEQDCNAAARPRSRSTTANTDSHG